MNIVRENLEDLTTLLKVTVGEADYNEAVDKALRTYKRKANIPVSVRAWFRWESSTRCTAKESLPRSPIAPHRKPASTISKGETHPRGRHDSE